MKDEQLDRALKNHDNLKAEISSDGVKLFTQKEYEKDVFEREPIWRWRIDDGEPFSEIETLLKNLGIKVTTL